MKKRIQDFFKHYMRRGISFRRCLKELEQARKYSAQELKNYQMEKLRRTLKIAFENVPFYMALSKEKKLGLNDFKTIEDLHKLPIIDKKYVRGNFQSFRNMNFRGPVFKGLTSGTTGSPAKFLRDLGSINFENAAIFSQQRWAGVKDNDRRVWLRGDSVVPADQRNPPFWRYNRFENQLIMSSYHLAKQYLPSYVEKILEFGPQLLQAYPSTAYVLSQYLESKDGYLNIPVVQTSSEPLYEHWRELIIKRLRTRIIDYYGSAERVNIAQECPAHEGLHLVSGYGITELIPAAEGAGQENEGVIVGTALNNFVMPLIRYKTGDVGRFMQFDCPCGCKYPRIYPIETKVENMLVTSDGKYISPSIMSACFRKFQGIEMSQVVQESDGGITVKIVRGQKFLARDGEKIARSMRGILGADMDVTIQYVDDIQRSKNGKFQFIISKKSNSLNGES